MSPLPGLPLALDFAPMEARLAPALPLGEGWRFEPKWDGFRCIAFRSGEAVELRSKSGKPLGRYFPDIVSVLQDLPVERFIVDGELTIPVNGTLSFAALQARLHPAESRVRGLAAEAPAVFILFDCLAGVDGKSLVDARWVERHAALEDLVRAFGHTPALRMSPGTRVRDLAVSWLEGSGGAVDGVVAKRVDDTYGSGERAMVKVKRLRTADCVVAGYRTVSGGDQVGSLLLGLYDDAGLLHHVGYTSAIADADRPAMTRTLMALAGGEGFTGGAPIGTSRWNRGRVADWTPLHAELVVEVRYDQLAGDRFRHGTTLLRWRPDKAPRQCTLDQLRSDVAALSIEAFAAPARRDLP